MKRRIISLVSCICILFIISVPVFAAEVYDADFYFWSAPSKNSSPQFVEVEEFDNGYPFDPGLDEDIIETEDINHILVGGCYRLSDLTEGAKYRFDLTLVLTPSVTIKTTGYESNYKLYTSLFQDDSVLYSSTGQVLNDRLQLLKNSAVISHDAQAITFSFTDIDWFSMYRVSAGKQVVYYITIPTDLISVYGDMYLANMYFGLESDYDEEGYAKVVNEKLDEINETLQEGNEKLDDIFNQDKEQHEAEMSQAEEHHEENKGLLNTIINGITSLPELIKTAFKNLIDEIVSSVTDSIKGSMDDFLENLKDKLGILYQAPDYFIRVIQSILITETTNEIVFPSMIIPVDGEEYVLNDPTPFQIFPDWIPSEVYSFINLAFSIVVIFSVINYAEKKWESVTNNG